MEARNLREMLEQRVAETPDWVYLAFYGEHITYKEFDERVNRLANALIKLGVKKGQVVYVYLNNRPEHLVACFACLKIGAVAGPVNVQLRPEELLYQVNDSQGVAIITESALINVVAAVRDRFEHVKNVIEIGDEVSEGNLKYEDLVKEESAELEPVDISEDDLSFIFYTSGTTGKPKGALLTHGNVVHTMRGLRNALTAEGEDDESIQRVALIFLPLFHVNAMMSLISAVNRGLKVALLKKFSVKEFGPTVEAERPEFFSAVPKVYKILLEAKDTVKQHDLSSLRFGICGAAPMPVETINQFEKEFGIEILEGYGLTEATVASTLHRRGGKKKVGSIGQALEGQEVAIMDPEGNLLGPGEVGEIVIRGPSVMQQYYGKDEETKETLKDGWLHTGDMGKMDEDGFFFVVDREKDMIIKGGENIYPKEIEDVISQIPNVHDVAVIGVPDEMSGEDVKAFVVPKIGTELSEDEILEHCENNLAEFKVPKEVEFVLGIPASAIGKALKRKLRDGEGIFRMDEKVDEVPLDFVWKAMAGRFNPEKAGNWKAKVAYEIYGKTSGAATFVIDNGLIEIKQGKEPDATAVVKMTDVALKKLIEGKIDAMTGINMGMIQVEGSEADVAMFGESMG
ncbi:MAG: long-chain-fatty-acid--CoA ligase, partial [bacterium]